MAPRFDAESLTLDLSVADLIDRRLARSLGFSNRGGYERLWLGQAIHSSYQEQALEADPTYRREVWVSRTFDHRGWSITVSGRLDGLRRDPDGARVVEEIKSVRRGGQLSAAAREMYQRQAQLYAWLVAHGGDPSDPGAGGDAGGSDHPGDDPRPLRAELVLIEIGGDLTEREEVPLDLEAVEADVRRRLNLLIREFERGRAEARRRREVGEELTFPYPEPRPGQERILDAVATALDQQEHVLVQAPTGIGKTVAALYPALRHCLMHEKRLFVLTAKTLQQEMATQVLELLNTDDAFRSLRLRAKAKMCANDQVICHEEYCPYARDYALKLHSSRVVPRLQEAFSHLDPDSVFAAAEAAEVCPFEVSLELSGRVQVTVCDYNYAFDPWVALRDFGTEADLSDTVLVVDEIHNLVERGRGYHSPRLSAAAARRAAEAVAHGGDPIHGRVANLALRVARLIESWVDEHIDGGPFEEPGDQGPYGTARRARPRRAREEAIETRLPEDPLWRLRPELDAAFVDYLEHRRLTKTIQADDAFVELYFDFLRFLHGLMVSDEAFSHLVQRHGDDRRLVILCKDPSRFLGQTINRTHSTIGLSATLSPPEFYRDLLGFDPERSAAVAVPSPFPRENRRVVIDPSVQTTWRERPIYYPVIAERLEELAETVPGNLLALFPSYAFLAEVAGRIEPRGKRVLVQRPASGDREREEILETLRTAFLGDVLLLAVAGGVFAEGVDYPGDMLRAVAVVGPCLPAVTLEQKLLSEYYDERFARGFEYAFVVPGMTRVIQAAGRLIRSDRDTGVIALLDQRFLRRPYRDHLPADWTEDAGPDALTGNAADTAARFFEG